MKLDKLYDILSDVEERLDSASDKIKDTLSDVGEKVSNYGDKLSDKISNASTKKAMEIEKEAKENYENNMSNYDKWQTQMESDLSSGKVDAEGVKAAADKSGYNINIDDNGTPGNTSDDTIDWKNTKASNYEDFKNKRESAEDKAYNIDKFHNGLANAIDKIAGVKEYIPSIKVDEDINDMIGSIDVLIGDYQTNILERLKTVTSKINGNVEWIGKAKDRSLVMMDTYQIYAEDIGYFFEAMKVHMNSLTENTESFYSTSSNIRKLQEYQ
ncbi:hypothetical protein EDD66_101391 [Mobilisporobacter senegalensis]|uniref:Uncharacterized protein n=1 Tax=Mobilisporobacter senegalensis TaxID=1329262 RepID=A0A3N1XYT8_9FIRM|nr:hypothetical protein [Mobilisporobacter senegalensis]ROR31773.1 hypothetical protein EDD66_101391 [Mobilisporobacter senegalensis]